MYGRILLFFIFLIVILSIAVWLADNPGLVEVHWFGWQMQTSLPVMIALWILGWLLLAFLWSFLSRVFGLPHRLIEAHRQRRIKDGYQALSDGLAAVASGDRREAKKLAKRADRLLANSALTGLLTVQVAEQSGTEDMAENQLKEMVQRPETAFLGYRGLLNLAMKREDKKAALDCARQAFQLQPSADGLVTLVLKLLFADCLWSEALQILKISARTRILSGAELRHYSALIRLEQARALQAEGDIIVAANMALKAHRDDFMLVPAAVMAADLLKKIGKHRKAKAALVSSWGAAPHPELIEAWLNLQEPPSALDKVKCLEELVKINPEAMDGLMALGEAALAASLWGLARETLLRVAEQRPSMGVYLSLARLEREEKHDEAAAQKWMTKVMESPPEQTTWLCEQCHKPSDQWSLLCPACGTVDKLVWKY